VKLACYILLILSYLSSCQKEEEILTGEIQGIAYIHNQDLSTGDDRSDVEVSLFRDSQVIQSTFTDLRGQYIFENIPYGKYRISLSKKRFIQTRSSHTLHHIGGYSPTRADFHLHEIPTFEFYIDSLRYDITNWDLVLFMTITGDTLPSSTFIYNYSFRGFLSNSSEATRDNYVCQGRGYLYDVISEDPLEMTVVSKINTIEISNNFDQLKSGTIYLRIYPLARGQGYWTEDYYPEALGKPSNLVSFEWEDLINK
jgi:hypothetical protein